MQQDIDGTADASTVPRNRPKKAKLPGRDPIWARLLIVFGVVIALASGAAVAAVPILSNRYSKSINQTTLLGENSRAGTADETHHGDVEGPLNFLLLGSDLRALDPEDGQRSDSTSCTSRPRWTAPTCCPSRATCG
jgi:hypothetical protein